MMKEPLVCPLTNVPPEIYFDINGTGNHGFVKPAEPVILKASPTGFNEYLKSFEKVLRHIRHGNSYLVNLTFETPVVPSGSLEKIFAASVAPYKLLIKDKFVVFSQEIFVRISGNRISSHPMKGTIESDIPEAEKVILEDRKEIAEHNTIVDLLRNDLSRVSNQVTVEKFRYIDTIRKKDSSLLQVSSSISGKLDGDWRCRVGNIIAGMLPAGSVTGAPKQLTVRIIEEAVTYDRGYYTGVFGLFDGESLDSGVMIRFIEQKGARYVYKSGGGVTAQSDPMKEYKELISKIYVPVG